MMTTTIQRTAKPYKLGKLLGLVAAVLGVFLAIGGDTPTLAMLLLAFSGVSLTWAAMGAWWHHG